MDKIEINLIQLVKANLNINEYLTLCKIKYIMEDIQIPFITTEKNIDSLSKKGYIVIIGNNYALTKKATKLLDNESVIGEAQIDEMFNLYPANTPNGRILHTKNKEVMGNLTKDYQTLSKKYLLIVKTQEAHDEVIAATRLMIQDYKNRNALDYMPKLETYINQRGWEAFVGKTVLDVSSSGKNVERL